MAKERTWLLGGSNEGGDDIEDRCWNINLVIAGLENLDGSEDLDGRFRCVMSTVMAGTDYKL